MLNSHGENTRTWPHSRMLAPTVEPLSNTSGRMSRSVRCAAAASPTGPAPITATGSSESPSPVVLTDEAPGKGSSLSPVAAAVSVVAVDPAAQPQLAVSPAPVALDVPQQDSFAAGSQHDACTDGAQHDEGSDMRMDLQGGSRDFDVAGTVAHATQLSKFVRYAACRCARYRSSSAVRR